MKRKIIITFDDDDMGAGTALSRVMQMVNGGCELAAATPPDYSQVTVWEFDDQMLLAVTEIKISTAAADSIKFFPTPPTE